MAQPGQPAKNKRNEELIKIRDQTGMSYKKLGLIYKMSKQASWAIYNRPRKHRQTSQDRREKASRA